MLRELSDRRFLTHLVLFCSFNILLYLFIATQYHRIPFNRLAYSLGYHHFIPDPRASGGKFSLLSAMAQSDSQWYLKIASQGYFYSPQPQTIRDKSVMQNLTFAYFPLFPLLLKLMDFFLSHIELSAFILANFLLIITFSSLYLVVSRLYSRSLAAKTAWLVFLFPFSVYFRSYYADCLQLLLIIWFLYFLIRKKYLPSAVLLGLLNITKGITLPLNFLLFIPLTVQLLRHLLRPVKVFSYFLIAAFPLGLWTLYNYFQTGSPLFFLTVQSSWFHFHPQLPPIAYNLLVIFSLPRLPFHSDHYSQIDALTAVISLFLIIKSRKFLSPPLWWTGLTIWVVPFITSDLMSFSRYQAVSFPIFLYLSSRLKAFPYFVLLSFLAVVFFITSLFFVNWHWVG